MFYDTGHVIDGLAADVTNSRLYWTDFSSGAVASVAVSGNPDTYSEIVAGDDGSRKPRGVALDLE